jgi:hypothetical protein
MHMPDSIEDVCQRLVQNKALVANCSGYLTAVAEALGAPGNAFQGNADTIRSRFNTAQSTSEPFHYIGKDPDKATAYANKGYFVVGGLTRAEMTYKEAGGHEHRASMGHVVVVVPGGPSQAGEVTLADGSKRAARGGYPYCYQGAHVPAYRFSGRTQVDVVFPSVKLRDVIYAWVSAKGLPNNAM